MITSGVRVDNSLLNEFKNLVTVTKTLGPDVCISNIVSVPSNGNRESLIHNSEELGWGKTKDAARLEA